MNHGNIFHRPRRNVDTRDALSRYGKRREKFERQMSDGVAKLRATRTIPGINRIERLELSHPRVIYDANQVKPRVGNRSSAIRKSQQRQHRSGSPDFRILGPRLFQFGKRKNHIADSPWTNQQAAQDYFKPYSLRALSRRTMRASSSARSRVISLSRIIPVSAMASASLPVTLAM